MKIDNGVALALDFNVRVADNVELAQPPFFFEVESAVAVYEAIHGRFGFYLAVETAIQLRGVLSVINALAVDIRGEITANLVRCHAPPLVYRLAQKLYRLDFKSRLENLHLALGVHYLQRILFASLRVRLCTLEKRLYALNHSRLLP